MIKTDFSMDKLLRCYYYSTGISICCCNSTDQIVCTSPGIEDEDKTLIFDLNEVKTYLQEHFIENNLHLDTFHSYFTSNNFVYNITFFNDMNIGQAALVAGPMHIGCLQHQDEEKIIWQSKIPDEGKDEVKRLFSRLPWVNFLRIWHLGQLQHSLHNNTEEAEGGVRQITNIPVETHNFTEEMPVGSYTLSDDDISIPFSFSVGLMDHARKGNIEGVRQLITEIDSLPLDKIIEEDSLRSIKDSCIVLCGNFRLIALESGVPNKQIQHMTKEFINQTERLQSTHEILELMKVIATTFTHAIAHYSGKQYSLPVRHAMGYIQNNFSKKISLMELANFSGISMFYLSKLMKKETGMSLNDNINKCRVDESKYLMRNTRLSLLEISETVGFIHQNHFSAVFKKLTGMSPSEYRNSSSQ